MNCCEWWRRVILYVRRREENLDRKPKKGQGKKAKGKDRSERPSKVKDRGGEKGGKGKKGFGHKGGDKKRGGGGKFKKGGGGGGKGGKGKGKGGKSRTWKDVTLYMYSCWRAIIALSDLYLFSCIDDFNCTFVIVCICLQILLKKKYNCAWQNQSWELTCSTGLLNWSAEA